MSLVQFTIAAVDKTRAAFASVNQGLNRLTMGGDAAQKKMTTMGLQMVGVGSIAVLLGGQVRKVAQDIESVPGVSQDAISSWDQLHARMGTISGTLGNMVASAGHGINSLANLIRFGWIATLKGVDAAQADVLENERQLAETHKLNSGWYDKLAAATKRLMDARNELRNLNEGDGASVIRRRAEVALLEQKASAEADELKRVDKLAKVAEMRLDVERDYNKLLAEHAKVSTDAAVANMKMSGSTLPLTERIRALEETWKKVTEQIKSYNDLSDPAVIEQRTEALKRQTVLANELTRAYDEQNRIAANAANIISGGFENAIFAGEGLRETIRGIGVDLMRYVFQNTITNKLGAFLTSGIEAIFKGGKAAGGPVSASTSYIVGENGPELFTPSQAGRIIPNHAVGASGGGGNTYVIDARGTDESVVSRLASVMMQLAGPGVTERRAINATLDRRARSAYA